MKHIFLHILVLFSSMHFIQARKASNPLDRIKYSVVSQLPREWQKSADKYFWPAVTVCATAIVAGVYYCTRPKNTRDTFEQNTRHTFERLLGQVYEMDPPVGSDLQDGNCRVFFITDGDESAYFRLFYHSQRLVERWLDVPLQSYDLTELIDAAMANMPQQQE